MVTIRYRKSKKGFNIYLDIYREGERRFKSLKLVVSKDYSNAKRIDNPEDREAVKKAEVEANKIIYELNNSLIDIKTLSNLQNASFLSYFEKYCAEKEKEIKIQKGENENLHHNYHSTLKHYKEFLATTGAGGLPRQVLIKNIDTNFLNQFQNYLLSKVESNTAYSYLSILLIIINHAIKKKIICASEVCDFKRIALKDTEVAYLTIEQIQDLFRLEVEPKMQLTKTAFLLGCYTGLRLSDIETLEWAQIKDLDKVEGKPRIEFPQQKTSFINAVPLNKTAIALLKTIEKTDNNLVFADLPCRATIWNYLQVFAEKIGVSGFGFHSSRHSFITLNLYFGNDLFTTSRLAGHRNTRQTERYSHLLDSKKFEAINKLPTLGEENN
jgi:integrase